ncbi:hypothetical protein N0V88_003188 [Collariella sp. IMI 366227]|nr:hypothetical protein N0V88_003188 [Collariella sp. IMI 366227]
MADEEEPRYNTLAERIAIQHQRDREDSGDPSQATLESGFGSSTRKPSTPATLPNPPLLPPSLAQINAATSRAPPPIPPIDPHYQPIPPSPNPPKPTLPPPGCLTCRDFSAPTPSQRFTPPPPSPGIDPIAHLAYARAVFAWCHHNIAYDVYGFLNDCIHGVDPAQTIMSGKSVCEGYGYSALKAGEKVPEKDPTGHAWNAVQIDGGAWKLVDPCWGRDGGDGEYHKRFEPAWFAMSNERFGEKHFPENEGYWYRKDGRVVGWEEYYLGRWGREEKAWWCPCAMAEGLDEGNSMPMGKNISVYHGEKVVRFQFAKVCEHWTSEKNGKGKPVLLALKIGGVDGRKADMLPLETDGFWHYIDVNARELGAPGQKVELIAFNEFDGKSARGLTKQEYFRRKGKCGYSYSYFARWDLVP